MTAESGTPEPRRIMVAGDWHGNEDWALSVLRRVVQPSRIMHGHLHRAYQRSCDFGYGPVQVTGLDADGRLRNFAVLNVADMRWELREGWFGRLRRGSARLCNRLRPCHHRGKS